MLLLYRDLVMQETAILVRSSPLLLLILPFLIGACTELSEYDNQQIKLALQDSLLNSTESWGVDMNLYETNQLIMNLKGSHALNIKTNEISETRIRGPVTVRLFGDNGALESIVTADSAVYFPEEVIFEMFGNVKVETLDDKRLYSEYLKWERANDKVSTPEFVTFIAPPDSITAVGFFGNSDLTEYTLNQASGEVVID